MNFWNAEDIGDRYLVCEASFQNNGIAIDVIKSGEMMGNFYEIQQGRHIWMNQIERRVGVN